MVLQVPKLLPLSISFIIGFTTSWGITSAHYKDMLLDQARAYKASIEAVRAKELEWRNKANEAEEHYTKELEAVRATDSAELDRLRKQLASTSRVPGNCTSASQSDDPNRRAKVSERIEALAEFSDRCARRTDELIIQLRNLQKWVREYY